MNKNLLRQSFSQPITFVKENATVAHHYFITNYLCPTESSDKQNFNYNPFKLLQMCFIHITNYIRLTHFQQRWSLLENTDTFSEVLEIK